MDTESTKSVAGIGLHGGEPCSVRFERARGPACLCAEGARTPLGELEVLRTDRGVAVRLGPDGPRVDLVEHLLAAVAAHGARYGLAIHVDGGEVPLADGAASTWFEILGELAITPSAPTLRITRSATFERDGARYRLTPGSSVTLAVTTVFPDPLGTQHAEWHGDAAGFDREIAWARTFGFRSEAARLTAAGRARHVDPRVVMVFDEAGRVQPPGAAMRPGELARHKLLDLIGDLAPYGGPPLGRVDAERPGHGGTHAMVGWALERGILSLHAP